MAGNTVVYSPALRRIAILACAILLVLVVLGVASGTARLSPSATAVAWIALAVAVATIGWHLWCLPDRSLPVVLLTVLPAGLAGAVLTGLLPNGAGYLIVFVALLSLGMDLPPKVAFPAALALFAATNVAFLTAAKLSVDNLVSNDVGAAFLFSIGVFTRATRVSQANSRAAQARAEELLAQLQAAQAAQANAAILTERTRLAREIHDILAHSLSGLVLALDTAELLGRRAGTGDETMTLILDQVSRAQRIARGGLADTRRAVSALRGEDLPGPALLDRLVAQTSEATGLRASLTVSGERRPLPPEVGLALYRTAQEALINSAKYAGRDGRAEVKLAYQADGVQLTIDDARPGGAAPPPGPSGLTFGGYGLTGMRERAELLGGELTAGPTEAGFHVLLQLPAGGLPTISLPASAAPDHAGAA